VPLLFRINLILFSCLFLLACSRDQDAEHKVPESREDKYKSNFGHLMGEDFLAFGPGAKNKGSSGQVAPMVNPYLWRATLETLNFMPLVSVDAMGGVIITDWYTNAQNTNEQLKVTVVITDIVLRADAIKVTVHKQVRKNGALQAVTVDPAVGTELENIILSKARQLKVNGPND
jgi:Domain of unknown function (DUF3576)